MFGLLRILTGWQGYAALGLVCFLAGAGSTWRIMTWREDAKEKDQAIATVRFVEHQANINTDLGAIYVPQFVFIQTETTRRISEIPQHVTPEIDRTYPVPLGFVRVFNDATHGPIPGPAAGSDADPSGVPLSDVAQSHTQDQGTLDLCRKQIALWWDWYDQQSKAFKP